jgi:cobalamin-independent methionine synthase catalytic subunit
MTQPVGPVALSAKGRLGGRAAKLDTVAEKQVFPWGPGTATGVGSMPGENPMEAARIIAGELPDLPYLAELPGRGPGADITGRAAALLVDIPVELAGPRGWRIAERPGRDVRRARSLLSADLDAMEEVLDGYEGTLKIQLAGPWTLAATIEQLRSLKPALADPGLVADLTSSLAEGAAIHVAEVAKRVPKATLIVQVDEPALPAVLRGSVPTPSGLSMVRAVDEEIARDRLHEVIAATRKYTVVHCCSNDLPFGIIMGAGADGVSFDPSQLGRGDFDLFAEAAEAGAGLLIGALPTSGPQQASSGSPARRSGRDERERPTPSDTAGIVRDLWRKMDLPSAQCAPQVVITPACGLPGASPQQARDALRWCQEAARILPEMMEELT